MLPCALMVSFRLAGRARNAASLKEFMAVGFGRLIA
jgi:hypothetical protein